MNRPLSAAAFCASRGDVRDQHDRHQRGVLDQREQRVRQRRYGDPRGLREHDAPHALAVVHPDRGRRLELAARHREDRGPDDLGGIAADVEAQGEAGRDEPGQLDADLGQPEEDDEQLHQQRGAADDRDVDPGDPVQHRSAGQPRQRGQERDQQPDREADDGQRDGALDDAREHRPRGGAHHLPGAPSRVGALHLHVRGRLLHGDVGAEVGLRDLRQGAVRGQLLQGRVGLVAQLRVGLAEGQRLLGDLVAGVAGDLDLGGLRRGEVVEDGDVVVHDRVDAALGQQRDGLGEALDRLHLGAGVLGHLRPVAGLGLCGRLALQVVQGRDPLGALRDHDHTVGVGVGLREEVARLTLGVDRHLVGDHVDPLGVQRREDRVELGLHELQPPAGLLRDRLGYLDVVAGQLAGARVHVGEGRVGPLGADAHDAARARVVGSLRRSGQGADQHDRHGDQQRHHQGQPGPNPAHPANVHRATLVCRHVLSDVRVLGGLRVVRPAPARRVVPRPRLTDLFGRRHPRTQLLPRDARPGREGGCRR